MDPGSGKPKATWVWEEGDASRCSGDSDDSDEREWIDGRGEVGVAGSSA